jgi:hypothetical protein
MFIGAMHEDLLQNSKDWENSTLDGFLDALAAWTTDMDGYFQNLGEQAPPQPSWRLIGRMLYSQSS